MRICTITVRGGSKGVPRKNLRVVAGKPLFGHSVAQAVATGLFDEVVVSSDSEEILALAPEFGATGIVHRPAEMASDTAGKVPAIAHAVRMTEQRLGLSFDVCVDLDATSPLRTVDDIRTAVEMFEESDAESLITGAEARRNPYFNLVEEQPDGTVAVSKKPDDAVLRRQDAPRCFDMNGSIYVWRRDSLLEGQVVFFPSTILYEMPAERSTDVDSEFDFRIVEWLMGTRDDL
ncbi:acylneuraminate cytidylyltransferase family protein [Microbacterium aerolatum]|uniref:Posttranslational modification protein n=1 Tax=Microbacterium aerolatum TaxID=153731 RepID=A0A511A9R9_9MICO|nr:acylneuraminate cytidylyltransferase family protein [Microbacterium aerolatum]GEK84938.1 posttranslational modification protein [Microbacterium aerolatum]GGB37355.1 posttranslational modification protein [Microbacterium aerolatum]